MSEWSVRRVREDDAAAVSTLLARAHSGDDADVPSGEEWRWLFTENPADAGLQYVVADAGTRLAGQYATVPVRLQIDGGRSKALLSLNTATDPDFQRQGIFTALATQLYEDATGSFALVYGFPNARSAPGFYQRLSWTELGAVNVLVRPLRRPGRSFARRGVAAALALGAPPLNALESARRASHRVERLDAFGDWADGVWERVAPSLGTAAVRDGAFLRWRFDAAPRDYRRWAVLGRNDEAFGYAVSRLVPWRGELLAYLMELQAPCPGAAVSLLRTVARDARAHGAIALSTARTARSPHKRTLWSFGFLPVRLGQEVSFGVRILSPDVPEDAVLTRDAWYLSPADFDWI